MTEKQYGGASTRDLGKIAPQAKTKLTINKPAKKSETPITSRHPVNNSEYEKYIRAGKIILEAKKYAKSIIKKDMPLLEIAENIEAKILKSGAKLAFPINLSINEIAAHDTPSFNDTRKAHDLLKVDIGAQIEGYIADTAFSIDLENSEENKKLIAAAEKALDEGCKTINIGVKIREVGAAIEKAIKSYGFTPIQNLSGHSIEPYYLHAGITIPNTDNSQEKIIEKGTYAVEPFATTGLGKVKDGKPSGIYRIERENQVRDTFAREILAFIYKEYRTLPFCARWIHKKFGTRGLLGLKRIEEAGILHNYPLLVEAGNGKVAQAEDTVLLEKNKKTITTL